MMASAERYIPHYTVKDYRNWTGDWELWRGIAVSMSPSPRPIHQEVAGNLVFQIKAALKTSRNCRKCRVLYELDWVIADDTVVQPDVLVTCDPLPPTHIETAPVFIAEVLSPSTADKDRTAKKPLYESEGVKYYAILDPDARHGELYANDGHGYQLRTGPHHRLDLAPGCSIEVDLAAVFET